MNSLKNARISTKIGLGFGLILALLGILAAVSWGALDGAKGSFGSYRVMARQTAVMAEISSNMLDARLSAMKYISEPREKWAERTIESAKAAQRVARSSISLMDTDEERAFLENMVNDLETYQTDFAAMVDLQTQAQTLFSTKLAVLGPKAEGILTELLTGAQDAGDSTSAYLASRALRSMLLARMMVFRYMGDHSDEARIAAEKQLEEYAEWNERLSASAWDPALVEKSKEVDLIHDQYQTAFMGMAGLIQQSDQILRNSLNVIGDRVASATKTMSATIHQDQNTVGDESTSSIEQAIIIMLVVAIAALVVGILGAVLVGRGISNPVIAMTRAMHALADGDKTVAIPAQNQTDELGEMAKAVQVFKDNMITAERLTAEQEAEHQERERRAEEVDRLTHSFDSDVSSVLTAVTAAADELQATAESMSSIAEESARQAMAASQASDQAANNVQTVATAAEELSASILEISRQVQHSTEISREAADEAHATTDVVRGLADAATSIGEVVALITDIAEQTNLLALNATIEAARAGDAGKGFAVVANEVKNLATQTGRATEEIGKQIGTVQTETQRAVSAIENISRTISEVNEVAASIAGAVEEQNAATQEIARNVIQASQGAQDVSDNISGVTQAAEEAGGAASQVLGASSELSRQADGLRGTVQDFLSNVRAV